MARFRELWDRHWRAAVGIAVAGTALLSVLLFLWLSPDCEEAGCPTVDRLEDYRPEEPPQVFDAEGKLAGTLHGVRRVVVELDSIPELVREGYVAVEDHRFREHSGVDLVGAFRALTTNLRAGGIEEGASTITMQLARNVFGPDMLTWNRWRRKLAEVGLAREIEDQLSKDRILELYLNQIYLGDGVYGVETAARHYFDKSVADVTPREAALLVGLARNPEGYDPREHPEAGRQRVETVLNRMRERGVIDRAAWEAALDAELELADASVVRDWGANAFYLGAVHRQLRRILPEHRQRVGVHVFTGLDQESQKAALTALTDQIEAVESGRWGTFRGEAAPDSLTRAEGASPYLQGMVVAMEPTTGRVTTLVGGRDFGHSEFDRAFLAKRQAGSAFKPIVYTAAISQGLELSETVSANPVRFARRGGADWQPSDHVRGDELTVRDALVRSSNTAAVRVGQRVGTPAVARQASRLGISSEIPSYPSVYLGAADVVPAELVTAYAAFANGGRRVEPHLITRVEDSEGRVIYRRSSQLAQRALDPRVAFLVLDVLRDVVTRGTGWRVADSGFSFPAAGKTGTTNDSKDVWFIGMTPKLVAGVWLGFDRPRTIVEGASGGEIAAPVWARFMQKANEGLGPMEDWTAPPGITQVRIDTGTGYAVPDGCESVVGQVRSEYFITGTEPREWCAYRRLTYPDWRNLYRERRIDPSDFDSTRRPRAGYDPDRFVPLVGSDSAAARRRRERLDSLARNPPRDTTRIPPAPAPTRPDTTRPDTTGAGPNGRAAPEGAR